jgi:hypothetical protein
MKSVKISALAVLLSMLFSSFAFNASAQIRDYRFHTVFIYNFTKLIKWPKNYQSGDFVIGVLGNSPIIRELQKMAARKTAGLKRQRIIIKRFGSLSQISNCHILFIPNSKSSYLPTINQSFPRSPMLVVTEKRGMAQSGSGINFVLRNGRWRFELNQNATANRGLIVSRNLKRFAIPVMGK